MPTSGSYKWDLMISYCWAQQNLVLQIKQKLEEKGFTIWFDTEQMTKYKNMPEAMGDGISNAAAVLMCISPEYEKSDRCEQEAEFVSQKNKSRIIIKVTKNYRPKTNWLEFLMGDRLYFEMDSLKNIEAKFTQLESAIARFVTPKKKSENKKVSGRPNSELKTEVSSQVPVTQSNSSDSLCGQSEPMGQPGRLVIPKILTENFDSSDLLGSFEGISLRPSNSKTWLSEKPVDSRNRSASPNAPRKTSSNQFGPVSSSLRGSSPNTASGNRVVTRTVNSKVMIGNEPPNDFHLIGSPSLRTTTVQNDPSLKSGLSGQSMFKSSSSGPQVVEFKTSTTRTRTVSEYTQSADGNVVVKKSEWTYTDKN